MPTKSCSSCPSFMTEDQARDAFGKSVGVPVCIKYGTMLSKPGMAQSVTMRVQHTLADECSSYGQPAPEVKPSFPEARVTTPDTEVLVKGDSDYGTRPTSCRGCQHLVDARTVQEDLGWPLPLCRATGRLIFPKMERREASTCTYGVSGPNADTTLGLHEVPIYTESFGVLKMAAGAGASDPAKASQDPTVYETDAEVTADDAASGIRAWRRLYDPEGTGKYIDAPIYRIDFFDAAEQAKIPRTGDEEHPEWYVDHAGLAYDLMVLWRGLDHTPCLIGEAGVGKTQLFMHMAWLMCLPFDRVSITRSSEVDDLVGKMLYDPEKGTYFQQGRIPRRWQRPGVLLLDEPNVGPDEVWQTIRPLTDNAKQLVLDQAGGEKVARHPDCYFGLAMNPSWDPKNVGTNEIGDADGSRLAPIAMGNPPEEIERAIMVKYCQANDPPYEPEASIVDLVMKIAGEIRAKVVNGELPVTWGLRNQIKVLQNTQYFGIVKSYKRAIGDLLEPDVANLIIQDVQSYID